MSNEDTLKCFINVIKDNLRVFGEETRDILADLADELDAARSAGEIDLNEYIRRLQEIKAEVAISELSALMIKAQAKDMAEKAIDFAGGDYKKALNVLRNSLVKGVDLKSSLEYTSIGVPVAELRETMRDVSKELFAATLEKVGRKYNLRGLINDEDFLQDVMRFLEGGEAVGQHALAAREVGMWIRSRLDRLYNIKKEAGVPIPYFDNYLARFMDADVMEANLTELVEIAEKGLGSGKYKSGASYVAAVIRGRRKLSDPLQKANILSEITSRKVTWSDPDAAVSFYLKASGMKPSEYLLRMLGLAEADAAVTAVYGAFPAHALKQAVKQVAEGMTGVPKSVRQAELNKVQHALDIAFGISAPDESALTGTIVRTAKNFAGFRLLGAVARYVGVESISRGVRVATMAQAPVVLEATTAAAKVAKTLFTLERDLQDEFFRLIGIGKLTSIESLQRDMLVERKFALDNRLISRIAAKADTASDTAFRAMTKVTLSERLNLVQRVEAAARMREVINVMSRRAVTFEELADEFPVLHRRLSNMGVDDIDWAVMRNHIRNGNVDWKSFAEQDYEQFVKLSSFIRTEADLAISKPGVYARTWARGGFGVKPGSKLAQVASLSLQFMATAMQAALNHAELWSQVWAAQGVRGVVRYGVPALGMTMASAVGLVQLENAYNGRPMYKPTSPYLWVNALDRSGYVPFVGQFITRAMGDVVFQDKMKVAMGLVGGPTGSWLYDVAFVDVPLMYRGALDGLSRSEKHRLARQAIKDFTPFSSVPGLQIAVDYSLESLIGPDYRYRSRRMKVYRRLGMGI